MAESEEEKKQWGVAGIAIPAGVLTGLGVGFFNGNLVGSLMIGLGGGFIVMFIAMLILRSRK